jgi:hypothetical protein
MYKIQPLYEEYVSTQLYIYIYIYIYILFLNYYYDLETLDYVIQFFRCLLYFEKTIRTLEVVHALNFSL